MLRSPFFSYRTRCRVMTLFKSQLLFGQSEQRGGRRSMKQIFESPTIVGFIQSFLFDLKLALYVARNSYIGIRQQTAPVVVPAPP
jgi:hypothetical protein